MAISYPISLPSSPPENSFVLYPENAVGISESMFTYEQQVVDHDGDRWVVEISFPAIKDRAIAAQWAAAIYSLRGRYGTFMWGPARLATPQGSTPGSPAVNGANQTDDTLNTSGWTAGQTNILKAGDLFQIDNQLYMNLSDVNSDGSGNATLDIWPRARNHTNGALLDVTAPKGVWRLLDNAPRALSVDALHFYNFTIRAVEAK